MEMGSSGTRVEASGRRLGGSRQAAARSAAAACARKELLLVLGLSSLAHLALAQHDNGNHSSRRTFSLLDHRTHLSNHRQNASSLQLAQQSSQASTNETTTTTTSAAGQQHLYEAIKRRNAIAGLEDNEERVPAARKATKTTTNQTDKWSSSQEDEELQLASSKSLNVTELNAFQAARLGYFRYSPITSVILTIAYSIVFVVGLIGNSFVVAIVCKSPRMRTVTNYFMANLALADILVLLFCLPATLMSNIFIPYVLGLAVCKTVSFLQGVAVSASINTMVAVTLDRFLAICFPMDWHMSRRMARWTIACIWLFSMSVSLPWGLYFALLPYEMVNSERGASSEPASSQNNGAGSELVVQVCQEDWPSESWGRMYFVCANLILQYLFPATVIILCYLSIWYKIERRRIPGDRPKGLKIELIMQKSKLKVVKMMMVVVVIFLLSWLPTYLLFARVKLVDKRSEWEDLLIGKLMPFAQWLGASNSCINPILYTFFNRKYKRSFIDMLKLSFFCCLLPCGGRRRRRLSSQNQYLYQHYQQMQQKRCQQHDGYTTSLGPASLTQCRPTTSGACWPGSRASLDAVQQQQQQQQQFVSGAGCSGSRQQLQQDMRMEFILPAVPSRRPAKHKQSGATSSTLLDASIEPRAASVAPPLAAALLVTNQSRRQVPDDGCVGGSSRSNGAGGSDDGDDEEEEEDDVAKTGANGQAKRTIRATIESPEPADRKSGCKARRSSDSQRAPAAQSAHSVWRPKSDLSEPFNRRDSAAALGRHRKSSLELNAIEQTSASGSSADTSSRRAQQHGTRANSQAAGRQVKLNRLGKKAGAGATDRPANGAPGAPIQDVWLRY